MTVVTSFLGYGETEYGTLPYGAGLSFGQSGLQFTSIIADSLVEEGFQFESVINKNAFFGHQALSIVNTVENNGFQFDSLISGFVNNQGIQFFATNLGYECLGYGETPYGTIPYGQEVCLAKAGVQFSFNIDQAVDNGIQFESIIANYPDGEGVQFESKVFDYVSAEGIETFTTNLGYLCYGYGELPYGTIPYGAFVCTGASATQFESVIVKPVNGGLQFANNVFDQLFNTGLQFESVIKDSLVPSGVQFSSLIVDFPFESGVQFESVIVDYLNQHGLQIESVIANEPVAIGIEFDAIVADIQGLQFRMAVYNTNRLRVLCEFPSRGNATQTGGNNSWGELIGTGKNWIANSQAAGDYDINNVNNDTVEFLYRSSSSTGVSLSCDSEVAQGIFIDTLAILNHNMTTGATINLIGSNDSNFLSIGFNQVILSRENNIYYLSPDLPLESFRYWRIDISDPNNPDGYIQIGVIVFGSSQIFLGECMTDRIIKRQRHFADSVRTEGFSAVKNDRSLKRAVTISFSKLDYTMGNYQALSEIFESARTSHKCLWIPTPSLTNPSLTERFAVFARMTDIPEEDHQIMGPDEGDYINITVDLDEAE